MQWFHFDFSKEPYADIGVTKRLADFILKYADESSDIYCKHEFRTAIIKRTAAFHKRQSDFYLDDLMRFLRITAITAAMGIIIRSHADGTSPTGSPVS